MDMKTTEYQVTLTERYHDFYDKETYDRVLRVRSEPTLADVVEGLVYQTRWTKLTASPSWPGGELSGEEEQYTDGCSTRAAFVARVDGHPLTEEEQEALKEGLCSDAADWKRSQASRGVSW